MKAAQGLLLTGLLPCGAGNIFMALAQATKQFNRHVLAKGSTVDPLLLTTTCVACENIVGLLDGFWLDLGGQVSDAVVPYPQYTHWFEAARLLYMCLLPSYHTGCVCVVAGQQGIHVVPCASVIHQVWLCIGHVKAATYA